MNTDRKTADNKPVLFKEKVRKEGLTHQGKPCAVGDQIQVTAAQREFLRERGFVDNDNAAATPAKAKGREA